MHFASKRNHQKEKNKLRVSFEGKKKDETRGRGGKIKRTRDGKRREKVDRPTPTMNQVRPLLNI